jgi:hypothetical protein
MIDFIVDPLLVTSLVVIASMVPFTITTATRVIELVILSVASTNNREVVWMMTTRDHSFSYCYSYWV